MMYNSAEEYYFYYGITIGATNAKRIMSETETMTLVGDNYLKVFMDGVAIGESMNEQEFIDLMKEEVKDWKKDYTTTILSSYNN